MDIVLNSVMILDPGSSLHGKSRNIHLKSGKIAAISTQPLKGKNVFDCKGCYLSIGWFDLGAHFTDPGFEHKESLQSGRNLAEKSGFTGVALLPNTNPVVQSKNEVAYITKHNNYEITQLYPLAAVSLHTEGKELTEMIDLHHAGAIGFTDGLQPIWHTDILLKSLQYLQKFEGVLINKPEDKMLTAFASMHEGKTSTYLGLKGMPHLSEALIVQRDISLLEYAGGKIHFHNISTAASVDLIKKAKKKGLNVTCDVAIHQLVFDDSYVDSYDTNYKVNPPLREKKDIEALKAGLKNGVIDLLVSGHMPQDEESKNLEFDLADFGIIGLQTFLPLLNSLKEDLSIEEVIENFTTRPRKILGLKIPEIKEGEDANLTLFDPNKEWTYTLENNLSISKNSPLLGQKLKGGVLGTFNNGKSYLTEDFS